MESDTSTENIHVDTSEKVIMDVQLTSDKLIINDNSTMAPVIIEELDENAISSMNVDMSEFVDAKALPIQEVESVMISSYTLSQLSSNKDPTIDIDQNQDILHTADEEDRLTKQFLNGELTFCEYSSKMDQNINLEMSESDASRYNCMKNKISLDI